MGPATGNHGKGGGKGWMIGERHGNTLFFESLFQEIYAKMTFDMRTFKEHKLWITL
ncbi:hypothetical protein GCM10007927_18690 [Sulfitobacter pacificus]|uniref:Uncharacterized protein n=1 Tax=Sulfitobacter pacificus TaxID=1499314 RepID=A0ABQ5VIY3_9RHOB|nr:hypothetical protein GCM10007927_18690 [Sulfitobacter pacificus]